MTRNADDRTKDRAPTIAVVKEETARTREESSLGNGHRNKQHNFVDDSRRTLRVRYTGSSLENGEVVQ